MVFRRPRYSGMLVVLPGLLIVMFLYAINTKTSPDDSITINMGSSRSSLEAIYKCAYENKDGTVDLVFNIPHGGGELLEVSRKLDRQMLGQKANESLKDTSSALNPGARNDSESANMTKPVPVKTSYPLSTDADYVINSVRVCPADQLVDYIVIVHSATAYFERRRIIRETYGAKGVFGSIVQRVIFLLGTTVDPDTMRKIREEALMYKDVVQGPFTDSYHNLTHKGVLGFRWISEFCPQAKLVIKIDDDVFMNPFRMAKFILPVYSNKTRTIACHLRKKGTSPITRGKGKWQVSSMEFKGLSHYPFDYCNGYFVILTSDLIRPMLKAANINPFFWIDDVYLFGLLPATVGSTSFVNLKNNLTLSFSRGHTCLRERGWDCPLLAVSQWVRSKADDLWYETLANLTSTRAKELQVFTPL